MKLVAGLGNPGNRYENTRHNVGFRVIDALAERSRIKVNRRRFAGLCGQGQVAGRRVTLLKPMTYMNRSGRSVGQWVGFYKLPLADIIVVVDDVALPLGRLRIRRQGSAGGHRGLEDVIRHLGEDGFCRLRVGIEQVQGPGMVDHVLSPFLPHEREAIESAIERAADAVTCWLREGPDQAMNQYNPA